MFQHLFADETVNTRLATLQKSLDFLNQDHLAAYSPETQVTVRMPISHAHKLATGTYLFIEQGLRAITEHVRKHMILDGMNEQDAIQSVWEELAERLGTTPEEIQAQTAHAITEPLNLFEMYLNALTELVATDIGTKVPDTMPEDWNNKN